MNRAEIKRQAKESLKGRWGTIIAMILLYEMIVGAISMVANFIVGIGSIVVLVISIPIEFGYIGQIMKFTRKEDVGVVDFFKIGFDNFSKAWSIAGHTLLKLLPYIIAFIVSLFAIIGLSVAAIESESALLGLAMFVFFILYFVFVILMAVKSYFYILTSYIGNDDNNLNGKEIVEKSAELMKGHRWEFFVLELSFFGWIFLSILTLGIGLIWLIPYMEVTNVKFYEKLIENKQEAVN